MHLTGKEFSQLVYVLMNTPEELTLEEAHDYTDIESKYRIKVFDVPYDPEVIVELQNQVIESRQYIEQLWS